MIYLQWYQQRSGKVMGAIDSRVSPGLSLKDPQVSLQLYHCPFTLTLSPEVHVQCTLYDGCAKVQRRR